MNIFMRPSMAGNLLLVLCVVADSSLASTRTRIAMTQPNPSSAHFFSGEAFTGRAANFSAAMGAGAKLAEYHEMATVDLTPYGTENAVLRLVRWPGLENTVTKIFEISLERFDRPVGVATGKFFDAYIQVHSIGTVLVHSGIGASFFRWLAWQGQLKSLPIVLKNTTSDVLYSCLKAGLQVLINNHYAVHAVEDLAHDPLASIVQGRSRFDVTAHWPNAADTDYSPIAPIKSRSKSQTTKRPYSSAFLLTNT